MIRRYVNAGRDVVLYFSWIRNTYASGLFKIYVRILCVLITHAQRPAIDSNLHSSILDGCNFRDTKNLLI